MSAAEESPAATLTIDPGLVRLIVAKSRAALFTMPDAEDDEPESELEIDAATTIAKTDDTLLSDEALPDQTRIEASAMIDTLNIDEQAELIALTYIGRGDFEPAELDAAVKEAKQRATGPASETLFLMEVFPSHLANGLDAYEAWQDGRPG